MAIRLGYTLIARLFGQTDGEKLSTTTLRLLFYIATLNFRGWVLYVFLGNLESLMVVPVDDQCWFRELMPSPSCHARIFDFSDHTVLYMAQILPLPLMETLHSLALPFWKTARVASCTLVVRFGVSLHYYTHGSVQDGCLLSYRRRNHCGLHNKHDCAAPLCHSTVFSRLGRNATMVV